MTFPEYGPRFHDRAEATWVKLGACGKKYPPLPQFIMFQNVSKFKLLLRSGLLSAELGVKRCPEEWAESMMTQVRG